MRQSLLIVVFISIINISESHGQQTFEMKQGDTTYVMQQYYMCFLYRGDATPYDSLELVDIQNNHLSHLNHLAENDKISLAGPFGDNEDLRGIIIFHVASLDEAMKLESEDPAIKSGVLKMKIRPWWAAKGSILK